MASLWFRRYILGNPQTYQKTFSDFIYFSDYLFSQILLDMQRYVPVSGWYAKRYYFPRIIGNRDLNRSSGPSEVSVLRDIQIARYRCRIGVVGTQGTFLDHREHF